MLGSDLFRSPGRSLVNVRIHCDFVLSGALGLLHDTRDEAFG